jgi:hypothetical protein
LNADFQKIKGARQKRRNNSAEFIGQQPKYSISGLAPRSAVILRRHLGDPKTKYVWQTLANIAILSFYRLWRKEESAHRVR